MIDAILTLLVAGAFALLVYAFLFTDDGRWP